MTRLAPENVIASQRAGFDATFGLAARAVDGFEKIVDLNTRTLKTALDEHQAFLAKAFFARDPQEFFALQTQRAQTNAQHVMAYWQGFQEIASGLRGGYVEAAQDQLEKSQKNVQAFVDTLASNAPAGSEAVVTAWKTAIDAATDSANSAYEAAKKSARQVVEAAESDASAAVRTVSSKAAGTKK